MRRLLDRIEEWDRRSGRARQSHRPRWLMATMLLIVVLFVGLTLAVILFARF